MTGRIDVHAQVCACVYVHVRAIWGRGKGAESAKNRQMNESCAVPTHTEELLGDGIVNVGVLHVLEQPLRCGVRVGVGDGHQRLAAPDLQNQAHPRVEIESEMLDTLAHDARSGHTDHFVDLQQNLQTDLSHNPLD